MLKPVSNQEQRKFAASTNKYREHVFWQRDLHREIWQFEAVDDDFPPQAPDWFFVVNHQRTGSSVAVHLIAPHLIHAVRYRKSIAITPAHMRHLLEAWRRCTSGRPVFGDKGDMYYTHFGEACERVFPGCRFILTVRHPLDTLSSYLQQPWNSYLYRKYPEPEDFLRFLRSQALTMLRQNRVWRDRAQAIVFEEMSVREGFAGTFQRVFQYLGVDPEAFDWEAGWERCAHRTATDRWRRDPWITAFIEWLRREDPPLREILWSGVHYLPETYVDAGQAEPLLTDPPNQLGAATPPNPAAPPR
jgi:hypothetical protein